MTSKTSATKPAAKKAPANKKFATKSGKRDPNIRRKVVNLRVKQELSWAAIGELLGVSPKTVRAIFDDQQGDGAHFDHRPLPGGRPHPMAHKGACAHSHEDEDEADVA